MSLLGNKLLDRLHRTTLAILALPTAIGLLFVALILQQGWPSVVGGPLPGFAPEPPAEKTAPAVLPASSGGATSSPQLRIDALLLGTRPADGGSSPGAAGDSHRVADASPVSSSPTPAPNKDIPEAPAVPPAVVETPPPPTPPTTVASPPATETSPTVETPVVSAAPETTGSSSWGRRKAVEKEEERRGGEADDDDAEDDDEAKTKTPEVSVPVVPEKTKEVPAGKTKTKKTKPAPVSVPIVPSKPGPVTEAPDSEDISTKGTDKSGKGYGRDKSK